jgi:hypothetical protein
MESGWKRDDAEEYAMNTLIRLLTGHRTGGASPSGKHHFIGLTPLRGYTPGEIAPAAEGWPTKTIAPIFPRYGATDKRHLLL